MGIIPLHCPPASFSHILKQCKGLYLPDNTTDRSFTSFLYFPGCRCRFCGFIPPGLVASHLYGCSLATAPPANPFSVLFFSPRTPWPHPLPTALASRLRGCIQTERSWLLLRVKSWKKPWIRSGVHWVTRPVRAV